MDVAIRGTYRDLRTESRPCYYALRARRRVFAQTQGTSDSWRA